MTGRYRTASDKRAYRERLNRMRVADPYTYGMSTAERNAANRAALYTLRHTTYVAQSDGTMAPVYHPFAPIYDPLADTMRPPRHVGLR